MASLSHFRSFSFFVFALLSLGFLGCVGGVSQLANMSNPLGAASMAKETANAVPAQAKVAAELKVEEEFKGYSQDYKPIKELIYQGKFDEAIKAYHNQYEANRTEMPKVDLKNKNLKTLHNMELGALNLEQGNKEDCKEHLETCLAELEIDENKGLISSKLTSGLLGTMSLAIGNAEISPYNPAGYEKVMLLNYKALNYLLDGDRKAFNVAKTSIDIQNLEREVYEKELKKEQEKIKKQAKKDIDKAKKKIESAEKAAANTALSPLNGITNTICELKKILADQYTGDDKLANQVSSAYVNPFADYLNGAIMEFDVYNLKNPNRKNYIDDAMRAYEKASKLNPDSKMLKKAANDMKKANKKGNVNTNKKLVHVVAFDGFAPEKKVVKATVPLGPKVMTIKLPKLHSIENNVRTIKILNIKGKVLATMDPIANMDAMVLRCQKDALPSMYLQATSQVLKSFAVQNTTSRFGFFGNLAGDKLVDMTSFPETRSWTSSPSKIYAARLRLSKNTRTLKIVSYNNRGRRIASETIKISKAHNFVYARSLNNQIHAKIAENLWVN